MPKKAQDASQVPDPYMECRGFRHVSQTHITDRVTTGTRRRVISMMRIMTCDNCGTVIETTYEVPSMRPTKRQYHRPDLYSIEGGLSVYEARREYLKRLGYKIPKEQAE